MNIRYKIYLIRHGATAGNLEGRYVGATDESILDKSRDELKKYSLPKPDIILASPLKRCIETAKVLFPGGKIKSVDGFRECNFGQFEYMNYAELNGNPDYQRYIDSGGITAFPGGEDRKSFQERCVKAFADAMHQILSAEEKKENNNIVRNKLLVFVVHGGTIMALMDVFAIPHRDYFEWHLGNGEGYEAWLDCSYNGSSYEKGKEKLNSWEFCITEPEKIINT